MSGPFPGRGESDSTTGSLLGAGRGGVLRRFQRGNVESRPHGVELPAPCSESLVSLLGGPGTQARVLKRELRLDREA